MLFRSKAGDGTEKKIGSFLTTVAFQGNVITSAMFMTAMAANPLCVSIAADVLGIEITWGGWFLAALVPGVIALIIIPLIIYKMNPPEIKESADAFKMAKAKLKEMGAVSKSEYTMIFVFILILVLWIGGSKLSIDATTTAFIGLAVLLLTSVHTWDDIKKETGAWDTLVWFAALVMMAGQLNTLGMIPWLSEAMSSVVANMNWVTGLICLALVYFYSHYFFASATAHVSAMYGAFIAVGAAIGAPAMLIALALAFFSNLFGCITHYGMGPAPVFFGSGFVTQGKWWSVGFVVSLAHLLIWGVVGGRWWKVIGLW